MHRFVALAVALLVLAMAQVPVLAQGGDVFMSDDGTMGMGADEGSQLQPCDRKCVAKFSVCEGGIECNYELETCIHDCACRKNPKCGPAPRHKETGGGT